MDLDYSMNKIEGPMKLNECILANVSQVEDVANISRLNLLLTITNKECFEEIQNGTLYLQGLCFASSTFGVASESFVLDTISPNLEVDTVSKNEYDTYPL